MDMTSHYADRDPELKFLDECIALIKVLNARSAMLLAEWQRIEKVINDPKDQEAKP